MPNQYGIPEDALNKIRARDKNCVYCHKAMINPGSKRCRRDWATIEHLNYLPPWDNPDTVVICCCSCNSSRGDKKLLDWFNTSYCVDNNINEKTVAKPVNEYISHFEKLVK